MQLPQEKTSFKSFHANFLKTNVYDYHRDSYNKFMQLPQKTSFKYFHANLLEIKVYHYYIVSTDLSIKYIL